MTVETLRPQFPEKLSFLLEREPYYRYKVVYGGRGGLKSWNFARAALIRGAEEPTRILCARETMKSLEDSVFALLADQVKELGLGHKYRVTKKDIEGTNGTNFVFAGLHHNISNIKSLEAVDICWVEEGQSVSKDSWQTLTPTIRKPRSEIWVSFNPKLETDETYRRFIVNPPSSAKVVKTTWRDAEDLGWFPEALRIERDDDLRLRPDTYPNVWEGECVSIVEGAVFGAEMRQAMEQGRIGRVPVDRTRPVDTFWDLGFGDLTAIWFAQMLPTGEVRLVDYEEDAGKPIDHYVMRLQRRPYVYGTDWLPFDSTDTIIHNKLAGGDRSKSIEQIMRGMGRKVRIAAKMHKHTVINAARTMLPSCYFDLEKCADGISALRRYHWPPATESGQEARVPVHDAASHGASAFETLSISIKLPPTPDDKQVPTHWRLPKQKGWMP
jgi:phage terminase large subunit